MIGLHDMPRFRAALERMCRLHGMPAPTDTTVAEWAGVLKVYPVAIAEQALDKARTLAGDYPVKAVQAETVAKDLLQGARARSGDRGPTRFVPLYTDDEGRTIFSAEYTCPTCEDGGWQPVRYDATGQKRVGAITMGELRTLELKQGRVPFRMTRCACKVGGAA